MTFQFAKNLNCCVSVQSLLGHNGAAAPYMTAEQQPFIPANCHHGQRVIISFVSTTFGFGFYWLKYEGISVHCQKRKFMESSRWNRLWVCLQDLWPSWGAVWCASGLFTFGCRFNFLGMVSLNSLYPSAYEALNRSASVSCYNPAFWSGQFIIKNCLHISNQSLQL